MYNQIRSKIYDIGDVIAEWVRNNHSKVSTSTDWYKFSRGNVDMAIHQYSPLTSLRILIYVNYREGGKNCRALVDLSDAEERYINDAYSNTSHAIRLEKGRMVYERIDLDGGEV